MDVTMVRLSGTSNLRSLVVGPSLGTSVTALWGPCARLLAEQFQVIGWDLPGHGLGAPTIEPFTIADLATAVIAGVDRTRGPAPFLYAGNSVGGAVGLQLALDAPVRLSGLAAICTGAQIGEPDRWHERAALVRAKGTSVMFDACAQSWFAGGFLNQRQEVARPLLDSLIETDRESYALVCEALAGFDVRERLAEFAVPLLAIGGTEDASTPSLLLREQVSTVPGARFLELDAVAHLAPAEAPHAVASLLSDLHRVVTDAPRREAGDVVRRAVLGDIHVDHAAAGATEVTKDFQELITRYAWGSIWSRPGLARRDRSIAVLTALVAGRHFEELRFHLRAALTNGLTREEIVEVLLQSAVYIGVPAANTAFDVANDVLFEN